MTTRRMTNYFETLHEGALAFEGQLEHDKRQREIWEEEARRCGRLKSHSRPLPDSCDPGVTMMLAGQLKASQRDAAAARGDATSLRECLASAFGSYCRANPDHFEDWAKVAQGLLGAERSKAIFTAAQGHEPIVMPTSEADRWRSLVAQLWERIHATDPSAAEKAFVYEHWASKVDLTGAEEPEASSPATHQETAESLLRRDLATLAAETARWRTIALELWMLLDAVDTADDLARADNAWFRQRVRCVVGGRFARLTSDDPAWEADGRNWSQFDELAHTVVEDGESDG